MNNFRDKEKQLRIPFNTDSLTGIDNRRAFDDNFKQIWNQAMIEKQTLSVALIDIDHFKEFNDSFGHQFGVECLRMVSQTLEKTIESSGNLIARFGGEEFIMILPAMNQYRKRQLWQNKRVKE